MYLGVKGRIREGTNMLRWQRRQNWNLARVLLVAYAHFKVISPCTMLPRIAKLGALIVLDSHYWKVSFIDQFFFLIKGIPLRNWDSIDVLIWLINNSGKYSIRSTNAMLCFQIF